MQIEINDETFSVEDITYTPAKNNIPGEITFYCPEISFKLRDKWRHSPCTLRYQNEKGQELLFSNARVNSKELGRNWGDTPGDEILTWSVGTPYRSE